MESHALFVRPATLEDLNFCLELDHDYETLHVWQMKFTEQNGRVSIQFQTMRLPQPLLVTYPHDTAQLRERWHHQIEAFYVSEKEMRGQNENPLCGYVALHMDRVDGVAWIDDLIVHTPHRRQGHGSRLLEIATQWARTQHATRLMITLQTKNYPAIQFYKKSGFSLWGYNETLYYSGDIALFFGQKIV